MVTACLLFQSVQEPVEAKACDQWCEYQTCTKTTIWFVKRRALLDKVVEFINYSEQRTVCSCDMQWYKIRN